MINDYKNHKIAVVHDHIGWPGGGERTAMIMALCLGADFITAYKHERTYPELQEKLGKRLIVLSGREVTRRVIRFAWLRFLFWKNRKIIAGYDIIIASGQTATEVVAKYAKKRAVKLLYIHTTPRRVFDKFKHSRRMYAWYLRPLYTLFAQNWKRIYLKAIEKFDFYIANSENIRRRFNLHAKREVNAVVWPPILQDFCWISQEDYFLSWGRIDELKRIELIAEAFQKMPGKKLIIASGGPKENEIRAMAEKYPNIEVKGWVSDSELKELVGRCRAAIYIPIDEDAGMTQLEANSAGKSVIGVREGGLADSIIDGVTGILLPPDPGVEDVIGAVEAMDPAWCLARRKDCEDHAKKYGQGVFEEKIRKIISYNDPGKKVLGIDGSRWEDPRYPGEGRRTGVEVYARNTIESLVKSALSRGLRVKVYSPRPIGGLPLIAQKVIPPGFRWTARKLSRELKQSPPDMFFTPAYYIPKTAPKKSFAVIHDVIFRTDPIAYSFFERLRQERATKANIRRSAKIFTVSEFSKQEIMREYRLSEDKIDAFPIGYTRRHEIDQSKERERMILYIGRIEKKKSIDFLIKAFERAYREDNNLKLVCAGGFGFGSNEIIELASSSKASRSISFPGYVTEDEKWNLLTRAGLYVHPSIREGSCIPMYEAWDAGVPVIACNVPVMREIGKAGAVYFNQGDANDLADKIANLIENDHAKSELIEEGRRLLAIVDSDLVAEKMLDIILNS